MKTPSYYVAPLRSRASIVAWLLDRAKSNPRPGYGLFCYDVKLRRMDTTFADLCKLARENGELAPDASPRYLAEVEAIYNAKETAIWDSATENARDSVTSDDTNRVLWNGSEVLAEWVFDGRSGGWLCLTEFDGVTLPKYQDGEELLADPSTSFDWLRKLYRFLIQCDHDFKHPEKEVEHCAAYTLFAHYARKVTTDAQQAEQDAKAAREVEERAHWEARDTVTV